MHEGVAKDAAGKAGLEGTTQAEGEEPVAGTDPAGDRTQMKDSTDRPRHTTARTIMMKKKESLIQSKMMITIMILTKRITVVTQFVPHVDKSLVGAAQAQLAATTYLVRKKASNL